MPPQGYNCSSAQRIQLECQGFQKNIPQGPSTNAMRTLDFYVIEELMNMVWAKYSWFKYLDQKVYLVRFSGPNPIMAL